MRAPQSIRQLFDFSSVTRLSAALAGALLLAGCGGDGDPTGPAGGDGPMSAKINGEAWTAAGLAIAQALPKVPGAFVVQGTEAFGTGSELRTISLTVYNVGGPGTYPLGVNVMVAGGTAILANAGGGWGTPLSGEAGTVTITALDPSRIAGTFSFVADATTGSATGQVTVTDGEFDLALPGAALLPIPENAVSRASATIAGGSWNASTLSAVLSSGNFVMTAGNTTRTVTIIVQSVAEGPFPFSSAASVHISGPSGGTEPDCCWGFGTDASGTITIESLTASRISGTFEGTVVPIMGTGATGAITVVGGTFDMGLR